MKWTIRQTLLRGPVVMSRISWMVPSASESVVQAHAPIHEHTNASFTPVAGGFMVGGPWVAMYRLAYEQALAMTGPSRFQRMLEPCMN